jgi:NDP-sugar pyrophosphorylase family protein
VVSDRPKVLAEVQERPFLAYLLQHLARSGIKSAVLCTGYIGEQIKTAFGDTFGSMRLLYSQETSQLGTAGALRLAVPQIQSKSVLIVNGDSFCDANLSDFWAWREAKSTEAALLLTQVSDTRRYGRVEVDADGRVLNFEEKGGREGYGWINAGIYLLDRSLLLTIPEGIPVSLERDMFPAWMERGLYGYGTQGRFLDIGTPESYALAEKFFEGMKLN